MLSKVLFNEVILNRRLPVIQLLNLLREAGYSVTQATVSRDIRELQLVKGQGKDGKYYSYIYAPLSEEAEAAIMEKIQEELDAE